MLSEKIIIMPSYAEGNQLKETAVRDGFTFLNMRIETLSGIAKNKCLTYLTKNNYRIIDSSIVRFYIYDILRKLQSNQQLKYFGKLQITPGFVNSIYNSIYELRMAGYTSHNLRDDFFIDTDKAADIKKIALEYERFLQDRLFIDDYELYQLAMKIENKNTTKVIYREPNNLKLSNVEEKYLEFLTEGNIQIIEPILILEDCESPLKYLYDIEKLPDDLPNTNIQFVSALGKGNESKEVIRYIKSNKINFDNVLVLYTSLEPYSQYFYLLSQKMDLPITFGEGISIKNTSPGKLYFSIMDWIIDNYNVSNFAKEILSNLPLPDDKGMINLAEFAKGIQIIIDKYSNTSSEIDQEAKTSILEKLNMIIEHSEGLIDMKDGFLQLSECVEELRVCKSGAKPGYIHLSSYKKGVWISRENTFIIGLDASTFPGQALEDPILLDVERQELGNGIHLNKQKINEKLNDMSQLLAYIKGNIYLSYSSFDTIENKILSPSSVLLQAYRLQTKNPRMDYEALNKYFKQVAGFLIENENKMLDEDDWWLNQQILENHKPTEDQFSSIYHNISKGINALNMRSSNLFTEYDGKVEFELVEAGIMKDGRLIFSSSQLETLASCPYKYFLRYILKIKVPDEINNNSVQWLDPASRGTLLHKVFERFYIDLKFRNERPSVMKHANLIRNIATDEVEKIYKVCVPPSNLIYELEVNEILETCGIFLAYEEKNLGDFLPSYLEMSFGMGDTNKELGEIPEIKINLMNGKAIYVNGKIDRVDKLSIDDYVIIDYKTGSSNNYKDNEYFKKGRYLQHALYAIALETIMRDKAICENPNVSKSVYLFPTIKGEGRSVIRLRESRDDVNDILEKLLNVFEEGSFISNDDDYCKYCDYKVVCENIRSEDSIKQMRDNSQDVGVTSLRGLGIYE